MKTQWAPLVAGLFLAGTLSSCNWLFDLKVDPLIPTDPMEEEAGLRGPTDGGSPSVPSATGPTDPSDPSDATHSPSSSHASSERTSPTSDLATSGTASHETSDGTEGTPSLTSGSTHATVTEYTTSESSLPPSDCGNGVTNDGEGCDDQNRDDFDGCSARCGIETWALEVNGVLSPAFDVAITEYSVQLPLFDEVLRLSGVSADGSHLAVEDATLGDGTWTSPTLPLGETLVRVNVVSGEEVVRTFRLRITRGQPVELYFKASNTGSGDMFGESVALSGDGNTLAVGAKSEDGSLASDGAANSDELAADAGAVYVFRRDEAGVWKQDAYVKSLNIGAGDLFGESVALSADGQTLAVGAPGDDGGAREISNQTMPSDTRTDSGAAYIFVYDGSHWWQQVYIKPSNADAGDEFGKDVELSASGDTLAVGAPWEAGTEGGIGLGIDTDNLTGGSGAAYVFVRNPSGAWSQQAYVKAEQPEYLARFGETLALSSSGDTLAVGAHWTNPVIEVQEPVDAGDAGTVPAPMDQAGAAYVFERAPYGIWSQQARLDGSRKGETFQFGFSVALSGDGNVLAVGANQEDVTLPLPGGDTSSDDTRWNGGAVYMFARNQETWTENAYLTASNPGNNDYFGHDVALDSTGKMLAVGAYKEDGSGTLFSDGSNANDAIYDSGAVYVFLEENGVWRQVRYVKAVNTGETDYFGAHVALSDDGTTLAIGSYNEEGTESGLDANPNLNGASLAGAAYIVQ